MRTTSWAPKIRSAVFVVTFFLACLAVYAYYRGLIESRRKTYLDSAVSALSIASDQLGSHLANLQSVLPRAILGPPGPNGFKDYVDLLIPALDPDKCDVSDPAQLALQPGRATILIRPGQGQLRFQLAADSEHCAVTKPELLSSILRALPDTFEDVLVASADGVVQHQSAGIGPRIINLDGLLNLASQPQGDDGLHSFFTGLFSTTAKSGSPANVLESLRTWMREDAGKRISDATSFSNVIRVQVAGDDYFAIIQPVSHIKVRVPLAEVTDGSPSGKFKNQSLALVGLINNRRMEVKASVWPVGIVASVGLGLVLVYSISFLLSCVPMKARLQRVRMLDLALMAFCVLTCCAGLTLAVTHLYFVLFESNRESGQSLEVLAATMADNVEDELCHLYQVLQGMTTSADLKDALDEYFVKGYSVENAKGPGPHQLVKSLLQSPIAAAETGYSYPFFDYAFWSDYQGKQIAKWSIRRRTTPETDMLQFPWFVETKEGRLFELRAGTDERRRLLNNQNAQGVYVEPLLSPNTGEFLTILMKKYDGAPAGSGRDYVGLLVAPLASLNAPVFPPGYGFSVVRRNGSVLYSSNPDLNLRENLLRECGLNDRLRNALETGIAGTMRLQYGGQDVLMHVRPFRSLDGAGWSIVTYRDLGRDQKLEVDTFTQAMKFMVPHGLMMLLLALILRFGLSRRSSPELWPDDRRIAEYYQLCVTLLAIAIFSWCMMLTGSRTLVFGEILLLPAVGAFFTAAWAFRRYRLAVGLSFFYPAVGALNGVLDAHDGLSPKYGFMLGALGTAICLLTIRTQSQSHPETQDEAIGVSASQRALIPYTAAACLVLLILSILPTIGYYRVSHEMVQTEAAMRDLVTIARSLEERTMTSYRYYSDIDLPKAPSRRNQSMGASLYPSLRNDDFRRPHVSTESERFVQDSLARNNDRYDTVLYPVFPHIRFSRQEKEPEQRAGFDRVWQPGSGPAGFEPAGFDPADPPRLDQPEFEGPELIDRIALKLTFANLRTPSHLTNDLGGPDRRGSFQSGDTWEQRFLIGRNQSVQLDYRGEWLRAKIRPDFGLNVHLWNSRSLASVIPSLRLAGFLFVSAFLVTALSFAGVHWLVKLLFFFGFKRPGVLPEIAPKQLANVQSNLIVLRVAGPRNHELLDQIEGIDYIDSRRVVEVNDLLSLFSTLRRPVVLDNFDLSSDSEESARAKLMMLEDLAHSRERNVVLVAISDPVEYISECLSDDSDQASGLVKFLKETEPRWNRLFLCFEHRRMKFDLAAARRHEDDRRVARRIYASCTNSERALLYQIAADGWVNPKNDRAISALIARGWVRLAPIPLLVEELQFMASHVSEFATTEEVRRWHASEGSSKWTWVIIGAGFVIMAVWFVAGSQGLPGLGALLAAIPAIVGAGSQLRNRAAITSDKGPTNA